MSVNDRHSMPDGYPEAEDFGLTLCHECDGEESCLNCLCKGNGWLLNKKSASEKEIDLQFKHLREARGQWD